MNIKDKYSIDIKSIERINESTDGNVYLINTSDSKYILKVYDNLEHTKSMIKLHIFLNENNFYAPNIIKSINNNYYEKIDNKYIVIYTFLEGMQIVNFELDNELIKSIAKSLRNFHELTKGENKFNLKEYKLNDIKLNRYSSLHFDLTKHNIFKNNKQIGFIDYDDAKYGLSIIDVSIITAILFFNKKGANIIGRDIFIDEYYKGYEEEKQIEIKYIKQISLIWLDYLLTNNNFDTSIKESFERKRELIEKMVL